MSHDDENKMHKEQAESAGFISRWARRKQAASEAVQPPPAVTPAEKTAATLTAVQQETQPATDTPETAAATAPAENKPPPQHELSDADMPDIATLDENSDYRGFMSPNVSEALRKLALRKMFSGTPFQQRDGLDDYDGNYTQFAPLGNIVTTDMKHMAAVEARRQLEATRHNNNNPAQETLNMPTPREAALAHLQEYNADPTGQVEYRSTGKVLVIGDESALQVAINMPAPLQPQVLLTTGSGHAAGQSFITLQGERSISLRGWLGQFVMELNDNRGNTETLCADLVLDMSAAPLLTQQIKPPGYFHHSNHGKGDSNTGHDWQNDPQLVALLEELAELEGTFVKPRYFDYNPDVCVHGSSGLPGCRNCIDACPTEAIISIGEKITVEPHLCQGGGTCATVCPSGAIRYNYPAPAYYIDQLRRMLKSWREAGGGDVTVLLHASDNVPDTAALPAHILPLQLEELASAGAELWAATLSFGAQQILLLDAQSTPAMSRQHLRHQLSILDTQLAGLDYPQDVVRLIPALPDNAQEWTDVLAVRKDTPLMPYFPPATQGGMNDKRQQWMLALDHLYKHAARPEEQIPLPAGAPFGRIKVDEQACTLCMACTTICPASALSGGTDSPQLRLFPANCVQCGLCVTGCPEQAMTLEPLFIANRELRNRPQLLYEEAAFHCVSCGKAFASQNIIRTMLNKLQGHQMFQSERARQRLKMCEDCRVVDVVQDEEAMGQPGLGKEIL